MAASSIPRRYKVAVAGASATITLPEYAIAITAAAVWSGSTTQTGFTTATVTTATSSVLNSLKFTGTQATPSNSVVTSSGLGAGSLVVIEYIAVGDAPSAK